MTRGRAIKKLQITLRDFRRLCILKGIYPRDPAKKAHGQGTTYYHVKDIQYLSHEPLLDKFREFKAFMKKVKRALGRDQHAEARRIYSDKKPEYKLDHLIKERYPRFGDALNDCDDALSMTYLFAALPAIGRIEAKRTALSLRLCREWESFVVRTRCLKKAFLSIKGIYYQAEVEGQPITWLVPYKFSQRMPNEVDFRIMLTFLEFYEVLLQFVHFRLYSSLGLRYPPVFDADADAGGAHLASLQLLADGEDAEAAGESKTGSESVSRKKRGGKVTAQQRESEKRLSTLSDALARTDAADEDAEDDDGDAEEDVGDGEETSGAGASRHMFDGLRFFCSREVPRESIEFVAKAFGGSVGWEGEHSPVGPGDATITHWVTDRPVVPEEANLPGRECVQPQWLFDCVNAGIVLPVARYAPNAELPPHLSPFVDDAKEGYVPQYRQELDRLRSAAATAAMGEIDDESGDDSDAEDVSGSEEGADGAGASAGAGDATDDDEEEEEGSSDEESGAEDDGSASESEDEADAKPAPAKRARLSKAQQRAAAKAAANKQLEKERRELAESMLSKKAKRKYESVMRAKGRVAANAANLQKKREAIEAAAASSTGKRRGGARRKRDRS